MLKILFYTFVIVLFFYCFRMSVKDYGPEEIQHKRIYGAKQESNEILFSRIYHANRFHERKDTLYRYLAISIVIMLILSYIINRSMIDPKIFIQCVIVVWIVLKSTNHYYFHHSDKFPNYAIENNLEIIRKRLKIKHLKSPSKKDYKFSDDSECRNYV